MTAFQILLGGFFTSACLLASAAETPSAIAPAGSAPAASTTPVTPLPVPVTKFTQGDLLEYRLNAMQIGLSDALKYLQQAPTAIHGSYVERAIADVQQALADVARGRAFVAAHPASNPLSAWQAENSAGGRMPNPLPTIPRWVGQNRSSGRGQSTLVNSGQGADDNMVRALDALFASHKEFSNFQPESKPYEVSDIGGFRDIIRADVAKAIGDILAGLDLVRAAKTRPVLPDGELLLNGNFDAVATPTSGRVANSNLILHVQQGAEPDNFGWRVLTGNTIQRGEVMVLHEGYTNTVNSTAVVINGPAFDGHQWLNLGSAAVGVLTQTFPTKPGAAYVLTFAYANSPYSPNTGVSGPTVYPAHPFEAVVTINDLSSGADLAPPLVIKHNSSTDTDYHWDRAGPIPFTAKGNYATLSFTPKYNSRLFDGLFLDGVSIKPASLGLPGLPQSTPASAPPAKSP